MLVRLLEMPADHLVVLDGIARTRLDPVREARVQLGTRSLEHAPVCGVADQHMVETQDRLAEKPAGVTLDQLASCERFEPRVQVRDVAGEQLGDRAA